MCVHLAVSLFSVWRLFLLHHPSLLYHMFHAKTFIYEIFLNSYWCSILLTIQVYKVIRWADPDRGSLLVIVVRLHWLDSEQCTVRFVVVGLLFSPAVREQYTTCNKVQLSLNRQLFGDVADYDIGIPYSFSSCRTKTRSFQTTERSSALLLLKWVMSYLTSVLTGKTMASVAIIQPSRFSLTHSI